MFYDSTEKKDKLMIIFEKKVVTPPPQIKLMYNQWRSLLINETGKAADCSLFSCTGISR